MSPGDRTRRPDEADLSGWLDQRRQDRPRSDLHEHTSPVAIHRLDHVGKPHGAGEMIAQPRRDRAGSAGWGPRRDWNRPAGSGTRSSKLACQASQRFASGATSGVWNADETGKSRP